MQILHLGKEISRLAVKTDQPAKVFNYLRADIDGSEKPVGIIFRTGWSSRNICYFELAIKSGTEHSLYAINGAQAWVLS